MIIYDFFAGTGSSTKAFEDAGHTVISFELDKQFEATDYRDIQTLNAMELVSLYEMTRRKDTLKCSINLTGPLHLAC